MLQSPQYCIFVPSPYSKAVGQVISGLMVDARYAPTGGSRVKTQNQDVKLINSSLYCIDIAIFIFSSQWLPRHLVLLKIRNFNSLQESGGPKCVTVPISSNNWTDRGWYFDYQDGGRPPSWLCYYRMRSWDHTQKRTWLSLFVCKIWLQSMQQFW